MKKNIDDFSIEETREWFDKIDLAPLIDHIFEKTGLKVTLDVDYRSDRWGLVHPHLISKENFAEGNQLLLAAWKDFRVSTFDSEIYTSDMDEEWANIEGSEMSRRDVPLRWWTSIQYKYVCNDNGKNSAPLFSAWYSDGEGWKFRD